MTPMIIEFIMGRDDPDEIEMIPPSEFGRGDWIRTSDP